MSSKHGPARLRAYLTTHHNYLNQILRRGFLTSAEDLALELHGEVAIMEGSLPCLGRIRIDVKKTLHVLTSDDDPLVQTAYYSYNASLAAMGNILRYDSPHLDHRREHHVHRFDTLNGDKDGTVHVIYGEENRPTLGEVVEEVEAWYYQHIDELRDRGFT